MRNPKYVRSSGKSRRIPGKQLAALAALTTALSAPVMASNGGCPAGQDGKQPLTPLTTGKGFVNVHVYTEMPLADQAIKAPGWRFRARSIAIGPGAVIPLHSHDKRPETATMKSGQVTVYETTCKVGYPMRQGEIFQSGTGKEHWVVNDTSETAIMYVVDLVNMDSFPTGKDEHGH